MQPNKKRIWKMRCVFSFRVVFYALFLLWDDLINLSFPILETIHFVWTTQELKWEIASHVFICKHVLRMRLERWSSMMMSVCSLETWNQLLSVSNAFTFIIFYVYVSAFTVFPQFDYCVQSCRFLWLQIRTGYIFSGFIFYDSHFKTHRLFSHMSLLTPGTIS